MYIFKTNVTNTNCSLKTLYVIIGYVLGMSGSDTNGNGRRITYQGYGKSSKVKVDKGPIVDDGILTWKVPGIKIDVNNYYYIFPILLYFICLL